MLWCVVVDCVLVLFGLLMLYYVLFDVFDCVMCDLLLLWIVVMGVVVIVLSLIEWMCVEFGFEMVLIGYGFIELCGFVMLCC